MKGALFFALTIAVATAADLRGAASYYNDLDLVESAVGAANRFAAAPGKAGEPTHAELIAKVHEVLDQVEEKLRAQIAAANQTHQANLAKQTKHYEDSVATATANYDTAITAAKKMTANQTATVAKVKQELEDSKKSVEELKKKMETLQQKKLDAQNALKSSEELLETKVEDAKLLKTQAMKSFNTSKATLMDAHENNMKGLRDQRDKTLKSIEEEKQLLQLIRGKVEELSNKHSTRTEK
jgi:hypothetical protein